MKLFWILFLFLSGSTFTQQPYFYTINYEQGLPSNEVCVVQQDDFGYIWMGCDAGLFRYNGLDFKELYQPDRKGSISNVQITGGKTIWCQNFTGQIFRSHAFDDSLHLFFDAADRCRKFPDFVALDNDRAAVMTDSSVLLIANGKIRKKWMLHQLNIMNSNLASIARFNKEVVAVIDFRGNLVLINLSNGSIDKFNLGYKDGQTFRLYETDKATFLLVEEFDNKSFTYSLARIRSTGLEKVFANYTFNGGQVLTIHGDHEALVIGTSNGCYTYQLSKNHFSSKILFPDKKISWIFEDQEGSTFYAGLQDGIFVVPDKDLEYYDSQNSDLRDHSISTITLSGQNQLLLGTFAGEVIQTDLNLRENRQHKIPNNGGRAVRKIVRSGGLTYIARGKFEIIEADGTIKYYPELQNIRDFILRNEEVFYITPDRLGKLSKAGESTLLREKGGKALCFFKDKLYGLFSDGLHVLQNRQWVRLKVYGKPLFGNALCAVGEQLYVGSVNRGICIYDGKEWRTRAFDSDPEGMEIIKLNVDDNYLIAGRRNGLLLVDLNSGAKSTWNKYDGFSIPEVTALHKIGNLLFVGTINGLYRISLGKQKINKIQPRIRLVGISLDGESQEKNVAVIVPYKVHQLSFTVDASLPKSRGDFTYRYRMIGLEERWNTVSGRRGEINYNQLPAGTYTFEIAAVNEDGVMGNLLRQKIFVEAPLWERWWFLLFVILLAFFGGFSIFRYRIKRIEQAAKIRQDVTSAQLTALKAQMNPHFMFNTLNSLQDLILQRDFEQTNFYLGKFATLVRAILDTSDKDTIPLSKEILLLNNYLQLEKLRFGSDFVFSISLDKVLEEEDPEIPPLLIQPYIENAIKHGLLHKRGAKELSVSFKDRGDRFSCTILDNGVGRKRSAEINARQQKHQSFSSEANEKRLELMSNFHGKTYQITIQDLLYEGEACGTEVVIILSKQVS